MVSLPIKGGRVICSTRPLATCCPYGLCLPYLCSPDLLRAGATGPSAARPLRYRRALGIATAPYLRQAPSSQSRASPSLPQVDRHLALWAEERRGRSPARRVERRSPPPAPRHLPEISGIPFSFSAHAHDLYLDTSRRARRSSGARPSSPPARTRTAASSRGWPPRPAARSPSSTTGCGSDSSSVARPPSIPSPCCPSARSTPTRASPAPEASPSPAGGSTSGPPSSAAARSRARSGRSSPIAAYRTACR